MFCFIAQLFGATKLLFLHPFLFQQEKYEIYELFIYLVNNLKLFVFLQEVNRIKTLINN